MDTFMTLRDFQGVQGGFFPERLGGGAKNAQIFTKAIDGSFVLSSKLFYASRAALMTEWKIFPKRKRIGM
jgi:hypothetical protein